MGKKRELTPGSYYFIGYFGVYRSASPSKRSRPYFGGQLQANGLPETTGTHPSGDWFATQPQAEAQARRQMQGYAVSKTPKPTEKKKTTADEAQIFKLVKTAHTEFCRDHPWLGKTSEIPALYKQLGYNLTIEEFHTLLCKWWKEGRITLSVTDNKLHVKNPEMGIASADGLIYFVRFN